MAVGFPIAIGLALGLGTTTTYLIQPTGNAALLFLGILVVLIAVFIGAYISYEHEVFKKKRNIGK